MKIFLTETGKSPAWVDDMAPMPARVAPAPRRRQGLRNWQKFVLCYSPIMAGGALLLYQIDGALTAAVGLAIWLATMLVIFVVAGRAGRL